MDQNKFLLSVSLRINIPRGGLMSLYKFVIPTRALGSIVVSNVDPHLSNFAKRLEQFEQLVFGARI